jgi:hypothetical protein
MRYGLGMGVLLTSLACNPFSAAGYNQLRGDAYPLDELDRNVGEGGAPSCKPEELVLYRGDTVKLEPPSSIAVPFRERLQRFERAVTELGLAVYGRAPTRILHAGTYACRRVGHRDYRLSEHALGNAIDVTGFRFPALPKESTASLPKKLRAPFVVTVSRDWTPADPHAEVAAAHARFFEQLAALLRERDLFRGAIGPADPNHETHLHLDMRPWPYRRL